MELAGFLEKIREEAERAGFSMEVVEEGRVLSAGDGIATITGLKSAKLYEIIELEGGSDGIVFDLAEDRMGLVLLTQKGEIRAGERAVKTERIASVAAGDWVLGRVLDPLGNAVDGLPEPEKKVYYPVERNAPALAEREFVTRPLHTGLKVIDSMLPIGRGQRELIIGDPSSGKTAIAVDAIISQRDSDVISVYAAIGQKKSRILNMIEQVKEYGDFSRTVFIVADASDSFGLQYIAPYSATAIAEYFMDRGRDVLVVYDDLTKHAEAYRALSLLLRRPPGREAFPGDIFFIHSRLLERSANIASQFGGGSVTALPIVETQEGRISAYIPTNLISITDGQIFLDTLLFNKGIRPAVDVGRSVSRIGSKAQVEAMREVAQRLKIDYSRFLEVEVFTKFGAHVEEETAKLIRRGERLREILRQPRFNPVALEEEVLSFMILASGVLDPLGLEKVAGFCTDLIEHIKVAFPRAIERLREEGRLKKSEGEGIRDFIAAADAREGEPGGEAGGIAAL